MAAGNGFLTEEFIERIEAGKCVLFAGSGLSAGAGFPTWKKFAENLAVKFGEPSRQQDYLESIRGGYADSVVYDIVSSTPREKIVEYVKEIFGRSAQPTPAHNILKELGFCSAITSNWDSLLEDTFASAPVFWLRHAEEIQSRLLKNEFFFLKAYGEARWPETLVLSAPEFETEVGTNKPFLSAMHSIMLQRSLVFVGCSLDGIENFLRSLQIYSGQDGPPHFAITGVAGTGWQSRAQVLEKKYGIRSWTYPDGDAAEMLQIIESLRFRVKITPVHRAEPKRSRLRKAIFENVGPFERLELDFTEGWNILLGNNGVGKSTVLKALGVAIAGSDAAPWADRLIRRDQPRATIQLFTDNATYRTTIDRGLGSGAAIECVPVRPMTGEGWLVLGFPPLRMGNWDSRPPSQLASPVPTSEDVLPLIRESIDYRLDQLKQWIVDTSALIRLEPERFSARRLLSTFFLIVQDLIGIEKLAFAGVDYETKRVMVDAGDGPVRLEAISQGMASLISWVGVVFQRLNEVFDGEDHPAIVLMDEIDAHMHPAWQRILVPRLTKAFPNIQFIVSTHSPMIVAGRPKEEIFVFERENGKVGVQRPTIDFDGLRADQVLTSVAFGLDNARGEDDKAEAKRIEYAELLQLSEPNDQQRNRLAELRRDPAIYLRSAGESHLSPVAWAAVREALSKQPVKDQAKLLQEAERHIAQISADFGI